MLVSELLDHIKYSSLSTMSVITRLNSKEPDVSEEALKQLLSYVNLGVLALHRKFQLKIKVVIRDVQKDVPYLEIAEEDVGILLDVTDEWGTPLTFPTVNGADYDITEVTRGTFLLNNQSIGKVFFVYTATPATIKSITDNVAIPDMMIEALLLYVSCKGYVPIASSSSQIPIMQGDHFMDRFEKECSRLKEEGFNTITDIRSKNVHDRGFS